jgi:hypothetical protein
MNLFTNLIKATVVTVVTPVTLIADVLTLPSTAFHGKPPFGRTEDMLDRAADAFKAAVKVDDQ